MTGEDHNTDAIMAALRSPALPAEQIGEAAAVTLMVEARAAAPVALSGVRSRRGVAIAAVTVASLGLGGLVAAGPGIFSPAADRVEVTAPPATDAESGERGEAGADVLATSTPETNAATNPAMNAVTEGIDVVVDADVLCADGCGRLDEADHEPSGVADVDPDVQPDCADGNHGQTVSSVANSDENPDENHGAAVSEAARSDCGKPDQAGGSNRPDDADRPADPGNGNGQPVDPGNGNGKNKP